MSESNLRPAGESPVNKSPAVDDPGLETSPFGAPARSVTGDLPLLTRLNRKGFRLVQLADAIVLLAVVLGTMLFRFGFEWPTYAYPLYLASFAVTVVIFLASLYFGGLYEREPRLGYPPVLPRAFRQTLAAGGLVALLNLGATGAARELGWTTERALPMPILNLGVLIVLGAVGVAANRWLVQRLRTLREGPPRVLLVGDASQMGVARAHVDSDPTAARVVGEVSDTSHLLEDVERLEATDVVLLSSRWIESLYPDVLTALELRRMTVLLRVTARETMYGLERIREIGGLPFVLLRAQTMPMSRARFKRFTDLVLLGFSAPIWGVVLLLVAAYQLAVVGRPLLFWQQRVGAHGIPFRLVKFRTMGLDAEDTTGATLAERDDPRVIRACRWLRASRLDELPQVWNVLRGEMTLVGPRPERPEMTGHFEELIPGYARRHEMPPGLTGLAQIHGRYHTDPEYKLGYDLQYLVNWSPVLDLEILLRTLWVVATRRL